MKYATLLLLASMAGAVQAAEPATLKPTQTIPLPGVQGRFDHFAIDVKGRRLLVAALGHNTLEVIDLAAGKRIFVNVPDAKHVAVIDRVKRSVVETWPMEKFQANFPMALDETNHRLFIGCRKPARLVVLDTTAGKPVADMAISGDIDDLFYDANLKRLYLSCGEGFIVQAGARAQNESRNTIAAGIQRR